MSNLVSDDMVSAALEYLSKNTMASAKAKADRVMAEYDRKAVRAKLFLESEASGVAAREAEAESHPTYMSACVRERDAVQADEYHRAARAKAEAIIAAWQSEQANIRAAEKVR